MANLVVELTSDEAKLFRGMQRIIDQQARLQAGFKKTGDEAKKAGDAGTKTHETSASLTETALTKLASYVGGWQLATTAINLTTQALQQHAEAAKKSFESVEKLDEPNRRLSQIAASGEDLAGMQSKADELSRQHGLDRTKTRSLIFAARSEGFVDYIDDAAKFDPLVAIDDQQITAGQVPTLFDKKINSREATALTLAAAEASALDFKTLAKSLPGAAAGAAQAGSSPEETLALLSVGASKFKSADTAADRIKALGLKLSLNDDFKGKGVVDALKRFQADPALRAGFAGESSELNEAINSLTPLLPTIEERTEQLETERGLVGSEDDILERKLRARLTDREFVTLQEKRRAEVDREIALEDRSAIGEGRRRAGEEQLFADFERAKGGAFQRFGANTGVQAAKLFGAEDTTYEAGAIGVGAVSASLGAAGEDPKGFLAALGGSSFMTLLSRLVESNEEQLKTQQEMRRQNGGFHAANLQAGRHAE